MTRIQDKAYWNMRTLIIHTRKELDRTRDFAQSPALAPNFATVINYLEHANQALTLAHSYVMSAESDFGERHE